MGTRLLTFPIIIIRSAWFLRVFGRTLRALLHPVVFTPLPNFHVTPGLGLGLGLVIVVAMKLTAFLHVRGLQGIKF